MSASGRHGAPVNKWRNQFGKLLEWKEVWLRTLNERGFGISEVDISFGPGKEPPADAFWNWWITFTIDDFEVNSIGAEDLDALLFEDDQGMFEDEVVLDQVPAYLLERVSK